MDKLKECPFCSGKARVMLEEEDSPDDWKPPQTRSQWLDELLGGD